MSQTEGAKGVFPYFYVIGQEVKGVAPCWMQKEYKFEALWLQNTRVTPQTFEAFRADTCLMATVLRRFP